MRSMNTTTNTHTSNGIARKGLSVLVMIAAAAVLGLGMTACEEKKAGDEKTEEKASAEGSEEEHHAEGAEEQMGEEGGMDHGAMGEEGGMDHGAMGKEGGMDHGAMGEKAGEGEAATLVKQPGAKLGDRTMCPIMGGEFTVKENSPSVDHNGEQVYFCCAGCDKKFAEAPDKHLAELNAKIDEANK